MEPDAAQAYYQQQPPAAQHAPGGRHMASAQAKARPEVGPQHQTQPAGYQADTLEPRQSRGHGSLSGSEQGRAERSGDGRGLHVRIREVTPPPMPVESAPHNPIFRSPGADSCSTPSVSSPAAGMGAANAMSSPITVSLCHRSNACRDVFSGITKKHVTYLLQSQKLLWSYKADSVKLSVCRHWCCVTSYHV
jgi:hypothetical protein